MNGPARQPSPAASDPCTRDRVQEVAESLKFLAAVFQHADASTAQAIVSEPGASQGLGNLLEICAGQLVGVDS